MVRKVVIIADPLNDFMPGGALPVPEGDAIIKPINGFIDWCGKNDEDDWLIIVACDWHPEQSSHFEKHPVHCVRNTPGAEFHPDLRLPLINTVIIYKGIGENEDGYSAFDGIAWNGFSIDEILQIFSVDEILICGLATDFCVKKTALDAVKKYKTFVLIDACRALTPEGGEKAIAQLEKAGVIITTTDEIVELKVQST